MQDWWAEEAAGGAGRADEARAGAMAVAERAEGAGVGGRRRPAPVRRGRASSSTRKKRMEEKEKIEGMTSGPIDDCFNGVKINHNLFLCNPLTKQKIGRTQPSQSNTRWVGPNLKNKDGPNPSPNQTHAKLLSSL